MDYWSESRLPWRVYEYAFLSPQPFDWSWPSCCSNNCMATRTRVGHDPPMICCSDAVFLPNKRELTPCRWAKIMPRRQFNTFGLKWSLNPGPFNVKEHSVIVVMAGVSFSAAYATDIILAQIAFYSQDFGIPFQLLLTISTQSIGYGIAGMMRKFLV